VDGVRSLRIDHTEIDQNRSIGDGGAIYLAVDEGAVVTRSTLQENTAYPVSVGTGSGSGSSGGGIYNAAGSRLSLVNSTLLSNTVEADQTESDGGGIYNGGAVRMNATTVQQNETITFSQGAVQGGGIYNAGHARIENSIFNGNRSTVYTNNGSTTTATTTATNCDGPNRIASGGYNLLNALNDSVACEGFDRATDLVRADPGTGRFANPHGGLTATIALKKGSPAIGHASRQTSPKRDQRGVRRDRRPDVGAFERR